MALIEVLIPNILLKQDEEAATDLQTLIIPYYNKIRDNIFSCNQFSHFQTCERMMEMFELRLITNAEKIESREQAKEYLARLQEDIHTKRQEYHKVAKEVAQKKY